MGLNRMMMKNGEVKVEDGSKHWIWYDADNQTISFTVPPGIKRIKVLAAVYYVEYEQNGDVEYEQNRYEYAYIENKMTNKTWGEGSSKCDVKGRNIYHQDIDSIVGVTPNKTYTLYFDCLATSGVNFLWGKAINDMKPTVEDY